MSLDVVRLDDRLIHGQVIVGWGNPLDLRRIVVADDALCGNDWEQALYKTGVPRSVEVVFECVDTARDRLSEWRDDDVHTMVLVGDVESLVRLCRGNAAVKKVNLGGLHRAEGRRERLPYVFLSDPEYAKLLDLASGVEVSVQDLPTSRAVPLEALE